MIYFDGEEEKVKEFEIFAGDDDDIDIEIVSVKQSDGDDIIKSFNPDEPDDLPEFNAFDEEPWEEPDNEPEYVSDFPEDEPKFPEDEPALPEDEPKNGGDYDEDGNKEFDPLNDLPSEKNEKYESIRYEPEEDEPTGFRGFGDGNDGDNDGLGGDLGGGNDGDNDGLGGDIGGGNDGDNDGLGGDGDIEPEPEPETENKEGNKIYVPKPEFDTYISQISQKQEDVKKDVIKKDEEEKEPYGEEGYLDDDKVEYYVANKKDYEQEKMFIIDGVKIIMEASKSLKQTSADKPAVRKYNKKKPKRRKARFTKEKKEGGALGTFLKVVVIALIIGTFLGTKGLAYYNTYGTKNTTPAQACFGWFTKDAPVTLETIMPFNSEVFLTGLGIGAGAFLVIALFVYLDKDQKKESRIGHEHGKARLATSTDYRQYTNNFMT